MPRPLFSKEKIIVSQLLAGTEYAATYLPLLDELRVEDMNDGEMESLLFASSTTNRRYGGDIAQVQLQDEDGIPVMISLVIDQYDQLFELDVWKVDFSPTKNLMPFSGID
ncbi:DUF6984 family protein [Hymenobacter sublimis]|uniref:DUF6984 domain-containing protein n=1 Tax=Hymenobacter sublimis TaxID=2933777 RepID=A0ABY4JB43_9BACT|nr:hypothetical protein [Hymenobacter sublimis]UPL50038.1 hypothetical protein MWH26_03785 [Hymenobacter sublimis]